MPCIPYGLGFLSSIMGDQLGSAWRVIINGLHATTLCEGHAWSLSAPAQDTF